MQELRAPLAFRAVDLREARDLLLRHRTDYDAAQRGLRLARARAVQLGARLVRPARPRQRPRRACGSSSARGSEDRLTFAELAARSNQLANWLRAHGVGRGDRILLMLGNQVELWETMLAAMKLGAVVIPATTLLGRADLRDRIDRGRRATSSCARPTRASAPA